MTPHSEPATRALLHYGHRLRVLCLLRRYSLPVITSRFAVRALTKMPDMLSGCRSVSCIFHIWYHIFFIRELPIIFIFILCYGAMVSIYLCDISLLSRRHRFGTYAGGFCWHSRATSNAATAAKWPQPSILGRHTGLAVIFIYFILFHFTINFKELFALLTYFTDFYRLRLIYVCRPYSISRAPQIRAYTAWAIH